MNERRGFAADLEEIRRAKAEAEQAWAGIEELIVLMRQAGGVRKLELALEDAEISLSGQAN
jgi:hypothetical protein